MVRRSFTARPLFAAAVMLCATPVFAQSHGAHVPTPSPHAATNVHATEHASEHATDHASKPPTLTVAQRVDNNSGLVARLTPLLPKGMTIDQAAQGFKNEGQFIAALHVSHNLNIPFADLKTEMTGKDHDSLGQAIHALKPAVDAKAEAKKAEAEAKGDRKATHIKTDDDHDADDVK
jgi:hypothetical protein